MTRSLVRFRLPAYAPGQGGLRRPRRDDSLSRLISAPAPGGGRDDCFSRLIFWNMVKYSGNKLKMALVMTDPPGRNSPNSQYIVL